MGYSEIVNKLRGFTIIELLVTVAVMTLLINIGISIYGNFQKNVRDTRRAADADQLAKALYMYVLDHNSYPTAGLTPSDSLDSRGLYKYNSGTFPYVCSAGFAGDWDAFMNQLRPYLEKSATDPLTLFSGCGYGACAYCYFASLQCNDSAPPPPGIDCSADGAPSPLNGTGIPGLMIYLENTTGNGGDAPRFGYPNGSAPIYIKAVDPLW